MSDDGIFNPGANSISGREGLNGDLGGASSPLPPPGFVFLIDQSGNYLTDQDGYYLIEAA